MAKAIRIRFFCCDNGVSTAASEIFRHWAVRLVQPTDENFAERCIYTILTTKTLVAKNICDNNMVR
jgi:hypothetical protein